MTREESEAIWQKRLEDAKQRLEFASNYLQEVRDDLNSGGVSLADGHFAYRRAIRAERIARSEFLRVLRIFHDLVVNGKLPAEEHGHGSGAA